MRCITGPDSLGLRARPEFEVVGPVISPAPIPMMHLFSWLQATAQQLLHHVAVLKNVSIPLCSWMLRHIEADVSPRSNVASVCAPSMAARVFLRLTTTVAVVASLRYWSHLAAAAQTILSRPDYRGLVFDPCPAFIPRCPAAPTLHSAGTATVKPRIRGRGVKAGIADLALFLHVVSISHSMAKRYANAGAEK